MATTVKMKVICPSCGARYRVDPARFKGRVGKIKCSKCEHQFPVRVPQPSRDIRSLYSIEVVATGEEIAARSLDTVKRLIIEGKVGADDLLGKPGKSAKRIGDIVQLQPFLRVRQHSGMHPLPDLSVGDDDETISERAEDTQDLVQALAEETVPSADEASGHEPAIDVADERTDEDDTDTGADSDDEDEDGEDLDDGGDFAADEDLDDEQVDVAEGDGAVAEEPLDDARPEESFATAVTPIDEDDIRLESVGNGRRIGLYLLLILLLAGIALVAIYVAAPDTFDSLLP